MLHCQSNTYTVTCSGVNHRRLRGIESRLLAPTGRAARWIRDRPRAGAASLLRERTVHGFEQDDPLLEQLMIVGARHLQTVDRGTQRGGLNSAVLAVL